MAGRTPPKPKTQRTRRAEPVHEWKPPAPVGWQHGEIPEPPDGLMPASLEAWSTWLAAWFAGYWTPDDLPGLRQLVRLYDQVERGEFQRAGELRLQMDTYGITPKGQQDRRYSRPVEPSGTPKAAKASGSYGHLRSVDAG